MNILVIADEEAPSLWDYFRPEKLKDVDLILSCGDLNPKYLSFLATFCKGPGLYVHGNHDDRYEKTPPEGCICIEDKIYEYKGIRIMGLGGSYRYSSGINQYTERKMRNRIFKMWFPLWRMFCEIIRYIPSEVLYTWTYSFKLWRGTYPQTAIRRDRNY